MFLNTKGAARASIFTPSAKEFAMYDVTGTFLVCSTDNAPHWHEQKVSDSHIYATCVHCATGTAYRLDGMRLSVTVTFKPVVANDPVNPIEVMFYDSPIKGSASKQARAYFAHVLENREEVAEVLVVNNYLGITYQWLPTMGWLSHYSQTV